MSAEMGIQYFDNNVKIDVTLVMANRVVESISYSILVSYMILDKEGETDLVLGAVDSFTTFFSEPNFFSVRFKNSRYCF